MAGQQGQLGQGWTVDPTLLNAMHDIYENAREHSLWMIDNRNPSLFEQDCLLVANLYRCGHGEIRHFHKNPTDDNPNDCIGLVGGRQAAQRVVLTKLRYSFCRRQNCRHTPMFHHTAEVVHDVFTTVKDMLQSRLDQQIRRLQRLEMQFVSEPTQNALRWFTQEIAARVGHMHSNLGMIGGWSQQLRSQRHTAVNSRPFTGAFDTLMRTERYVFQLLHVLRELVNKVSPTSRDLLESIHQGGYETLIGNGNLDVRVAIYEREEVQAAAAEPPNDDLELRRIVRAINRLGHTQMAADATLLDQYPAELISQWSHLQGIPLHPRLREYLGDAAYKERMMYGCFVPPRVAQPRLDLLPAQTANNLRQTPAYSCIRPMTMASADELQHIGQAQAQALRGFPDDAFVWREQR